MVDVEAEAMKMSERQVPLVKVNDAICLRERENSWAPDKNNLNGLQARGYTIGETIGEGKYAKVKKGLFNQTQETVAIKVINKSQLHPVDRKKFLPREIKFLRSLQHPGLLYVSNVLECERQYYIVMEYAVNGDLTEFINKKGCLVEADARRLFKQLLNVVSYLHSNNVCHRDIKCDNILLDGQFNLKLADFGFAKKVSRKKLLETTCGSYVYTAPEVLDGERYDGFAADIWSMGICLYCMLCGKLPFRDNDIDILRDSMTEKLVFSRYVSRDCRGLLNHILSPDPVLRPVIVEIIKHKWMSKPLKGAGDSSVSAMSIQAVTDNRVQIDPTTEHGFNCDQQILPTKTTRVKEMLEAVAEVHSTGGSSVDLTKIPQIKNNSTAQLTGVTGPVGRRLSQQILQTNEGTCSKLEPKKVTKSGNKFSTAVKSLKKFKTAAVAVKAVNRFRRSPLKTILKISQEQAIQIVVEQATKNIEQDKKNLHRCESGKVAKRCMSDRNIRYQEQLKPIVEKIIHDEENVEKEELLKSTMCYLRPPRTSDSSPSVKEGYLY